MTAREAASELLRWFKVNRRDLPWRNEPRNPYHVWVSEVMLQQTQVGTVIGYFKRWMEIFPDVSTLTAAPLDAVLKAWEGLGYYSRARNLHKAARVVVEEYGGRLPRTARALQRLPGIGFYTAAAIASIAFGEDVIAVDGNIRRVASRLFAVKKAMTRGEVEKNLQILFEPGKAGTLNEALMELGALCCSPSNPSCDECPFQPFCRAYRTGSPGNFPTRKEKKRIPHVKRNGLLILGEGDSVFLHRRPENVMLGGLWGVPLLAEGDESSAAGAEAILEDVSHVYTHFRITVTPLVVREEDAPWDLTKGSFVSSAEIPRLALSTLDHKILRRLEAHRPNRLKNS